MTRDELIREMRANRASWPAVLFVYALILGTMIVTGIAITG